MEFESRRSTIMAQNGMVATSQPLAAMAGLRTMMNGGTGGTDRSGADRDESEDVALGVLPPAFGVGSQNGS